LTTGCERLRTALNEAKSKSSLSSLPDFHIELLRLRQNWRLRKVGNSVLGDLSYRTAGSRFPQTGIFEVNKAEEVPDESEEDKSSVPGVSSSSAKPNSALTVTVPNELQGIAYIEVVIQKDQETLSFANIGLPSPAPAPVDAHWQQRLEAAQNVLFCKELFSVLAREAVALHSLPIPPLVVGNQITSTLFPGILLIISLCHSIKGKPITPPVTPKLEHNHVLEHSLHQLLREVHRTNSCIPLPHPASAPIGVSRKRRLAGPYAHDRQTLLNMTKKEGILEEIIRQSQHVVLRMRTSFVLDELARHVKDPLIVAHWASLNAVTHSCVRITLISSG
jgi:mediator of RNA polymerase II transcription subunit 17